MTSQAVATRIGVLQEGFEAVCMARALPLFVNQRIRMAIGAFLGWFFTKR